jgi:cell division protein FtsW (lipid II flippase)
VPERELFREYLAKVCEQIRWKKAHKAVRRELGNHLEDEAAALLESGATEDEAAQGAVRDMGDALFIGSQLDRSYRPRPAWGVIAVTAALMIIGFFARDYAIRHIESSNHVVDVPRSLFFIGAAVLALIVGYFLDYTIAAKRPLVLGAGFLAFTALLPFLNNEYQYGIHYNICYYSVYLVVFIPVIYAAILWWWPYKGYMGLIGCYLALIVIALVWAVCGWYPLATLNCCICGLMLTAELLKGKFNVKKPCGLAVLYCPIAAFAVFVMRTPLGEAIAERIWSAIYPWNEPRGEGYTAAQVRLRLDQALWFGEGATTPQMGHLPYLGEDYILTYFIHKFGWISLAVVLLLLGALFAFSISQIRRQKSKLGRMMASAILAALGFQCALYIVGNLGAPILGFLALPLLSFSNAALVLDSFLIGLMLSVFRTNDIVRDVAVAPKTILRFKITFERVE